MLTRLQVDGFKNLVDVDVRFGPFTCIAGPNGVGKSNLFDAIAFLSALADKTLIDAALSVRGGEGQAGDVRSLFRRAGESVHEHMKFQVEMIIPKSGEDGLGQKAEASMTFLKYSIELRYRPDSPGRPLGSIELVSERLVHMNRTDARKSIGFEHHKRWRDSAVIGRRTSPYISNEKDKHGNRIIALHGDSKGRTGGRPRRLLAENLPRTMLSSANNAEEHRTLVLARQEMMSWMQLQLEPSALRSPDPFTAPHSIGANGAHVPATLYHLAHLAAQAEPGSDEDLYADVANRLSRLAENVRAVSVDRDEKRQLLNILMTDLEGTPHLASSLSDGTLRFLALTVMESDPSLRPLVCLEEPENGMHPARIPAMLALLQDLAVDANETIGPDNPLRQVIVNTHSPAVVAQVPDDTLLVAWANQTWNHEKRLSRLDFLPLPDTWRTTIDDTVQPLPKGALQDYLNPISDHDMLDATRKHGRHPSRPQVRQRPDVQLLLQYPTLPGEA